MFTFVHNLSKNTVTEKRVFASCWWVRSHEQFKVTPGTKPATEMLVLYLKNNCVSTCYSYILNDTALGSYFFSYWFYSLSQQTSYQYFVFVVEGDYECLVKSKKQLVNDNSDKHEANCEQRVFMWAWQRSTLRACVRQLMYGGWVNMVEEWWWWDQTQATWGPLTMQVSPCSMSTVYIHTHIPHKCIYARNTTQKKHIYLYM